MDDWNDLTGIARVTGMTKTKRLTGITGMTVMIRMTTVNGLTVITRKIRMAGKEGMQVWMTGMTGMTRISWLTKTTRLDDNREWDDCDDKYN